MAEAVVKTNSIAPAHLVGLGVALALGAIARFSDPGVIDWSRDHTAIASLALDLAEGVRLPMIGPQSSGGIPHSPFFSYYPALAYVFSADPVVMTASLAGLNLLGLALLWFVGHRYFGPRVAFVAAMAYAVNPWVVAFSRTIWSGDHRAPLFVAAVACGLLGFAEGRRWAQVLFGPIFIIAVQIHHAGFTLVPVGLWLVLAGRRMSRAVFGTSLALTAAAILPFAVGLLQYSLHVPEAAASITPHEPDLSPRGLIRPLGQFAWVTAGVGFEQYVAREFAGELVDRVRWFVPLWWLQGGLACLGWIVMWRQPRMLSVMLALWTVTTVGTFSIPVLAVFPHYFASVVPGVCLVVGLGADRVMAWIAARSGVSPWAAWALVATIWASQLSYMLMVRRFVDTVFTPTQFGFGTPVRYLEAVAREVAPYERVVFVVDDDWVDLSRTGTSVFSIFLRHSASCMADVHRSSRTAIVPPPPFAVIWSPRVDGDAFLEQAYGRPTWKVFPLRTGEGDYRVAVVDAATTGVFGLTPIAGLPQTGPLQPTAYGVGADDLVIEWAVVSSPSPETDYSVGLRDEAGSTVWSATIRVPAIDGDCAGTRLVSRVEGPIPTQGTEFFLQPSNAPERRWTRRQGPDVRSER
jgi:hypothetical protein